MKYTITLTAEDLAFVETVPSEYVAELIKAMHSKMNGKETQVAEYVQKDWVKLERLMQPIKKQAEGTSHVCQVCADRLNSLIGTRYKASSQSMKTHVSARIREGYTEQDFIEVIDKMVSEWQGTDMEKFLRPETLFGTKFEGYLNRSVSVGVTPTAEQLRKNDYSEGL